MEGELIIMACSFITIFADVSAGKEAVLEFSFLLGVIKKALKGLQYKANLPHWDLRELLLLS